MKDATTEQTTRVVARGGGYESTDPGVRLDHRAVIYLRVSSAGQLNTDHDAEGFSIPAQREACLRKAESLGAVVVGEYTDAAESARSADRPQLKALLERLAAQRDVDFVIVHKVDRLARNRADDVDITLRIRQAGAALVSVSENIDETPSGMLMHGIMSSIAEFYSGNLATEIKKGMNQKAKKGGAPHMAPIGYLNHRLFENGKELRTIIPDPVRGPLVTWAFEAYATGDYTLRQLTEALRAQGFTNPASAKRPERPVAMQRVHVMLQRKFYVGLVVWQGVEYVGRHKPLVDIETFATVQALLHARSKSGEKSSKHTHYLKGSLFCGQCGSAMGFVHANGRSAIYDYFFCWGRALRKTKCDLPYIKSDLLEAHVAAKYADVHLEPKTALAIKEGLTEFMKLRTRSADKLARISRNRVAALEAERRKLLQAHYAGAIPLNLLKEEQDRITGQLADAGAALANTEIDWEQYGSNISAAIGLIDCLQEAYERARPVTRRQIKGLPRLWLTPFLTFQAAASW